MWEWREGGECVYSVYVNACVTECLQRFCVSMRVCVNATQCASDHGRSHHQHPCQQDGRDDVGSEGVACQISHQLVILLRQRES